MRYRIGDTLSDVEVYVLADPKDDTVGDAKDKKNYNWTLSMSTPRHCSTYWLLL